MKTTAPARRLGAGAIAAADRADAAGMGIDQRGADRGSRQQAEIARTEVALLDQIFDVLVRDFSRHALTLHSKPLATQAQQEQAMRMVRRPVADDFRFDLVVSRARALAGSYEMNP